MWILPKSITSVFAQDTEALTLDSVAASQICGHLLTVRSKHSQSKIFLREWKKNNWMRLRYGAISSPSLGKLFTTWWTSLVEVTRVNHSPHRDYAKEPEMKGTCGPILQKELPFCDQASASWKMSKGTLPLGSVTYCNSWESWVTDRRGEYSARLSAARHTSESDYSYLPTPCANEDSFRLNGNSQQSKTLEAKARRGELKTIGSAINVDCLSLTAAHATMLNLSVLSVANGRTHLCGAQKTHVPHVEQIGQAGVTQQRGPLNPQFVEVMMGLPIGWTDCASLATESSQQQQP